ncbi:MAG: hypothetical protein ACREUU_04085 [Gammaproteobacteria bacterium]
MAQGAAQFCRRPIFERLSGYDESQFMGSNRWDTRDRFHRMLERLGQEVRVGDADAIRKYARPTAEE